MCPSRGPGLGCAFPEGRKKRRNPPAEGSTLSSGLEVAGIRLAVSTGRSFRRGGAFSQLSPSCLAASVPVSTCSQTGASASPQGKDGPSGTSVGVESRRSLTENTAAGLRVWIGV